MNLAMSYLSLFPITPAGDLRQLPANLGISSSDCIYKREMVAALIASLRTSLLDCKDKGEMVAAG